MQVVEHVESKQRQYALADRAQSMGWSASAVEVIDEDQGKSGATAEGRHGFARLASAVADGEAGAIFALEVSRLARSSEDWQRLLALCAVAGVVVIDEQAVYDPANHDDKMLLELKGAMSEAELNWLRLRLVGGRRHKARRGELWSLAPVGYVWRDKAFALDPDEAVQRAVRSVFTRFAIEPSAYAVVRWANTTGLMFPARAAGDDGTGEVRWRPLTASRLCSALHNPIYTGTYVYGREPNKKVIVDGKIRVKRNLSAEPHEWWAKLDGRHPAYIDWETYVANKKKLRDNLSPTKHTAGTTGAPREGAALLTGLLLCGRCGRRMRTDYATAAHRRWSYVCEGEHRQASSICWSLPGHRLDEAVTKTFLERMVPAELDVSIAVERELAVEADALAEQWKARIEQARYEARRAERRYKAVDPDNRVVARTLESEWEEKLRQVEEIERDFAEARRARRIDLSAEDRASIRAIAHDLPALWRADTTPVSDRRAMLRTVIDVVAVSPIDIPHRETLVRVQWKSQHVTALRIPRPGRLATSDSARDRVQALVAKRMTDEQIAATLNGEKIQRASGKPWTPIAVRRVRQRLGLACGEARPTSRPVPDRHPKTGWYSIPGAVRVFGISRRIVRYWIDRDLVRSQHDTVDGRVTRWLSIDDTLVKRLRSSKTRSAKH
jgi:DNA invertase Pin-like site-specific DNA recombinase